MLQRRTLNLKAIAALLICVAGAGVILRYWPALDAPRAHSLGASPISLCTGDFNGDGTDDLAVGTAGPHGVTLMQRRNDGAWLVSDRFSLEGPVVSIACGRFDPAVVGDTIVADYNGIVESGLALITPSRSRKALPISFSAAPWRPVHILAVDVNRDGIDDLLVAAANRDASELQVLTAQPAGFRLLGVVARYPGAYAIMSLGAATSPDGNLRVVLTDFLASKIRILHLGKDGSLQREQIINEPAFDAQLVDLNSDGTLDVISVYDITGGPGKISFRPGRGVDFDPPSYAHVPGRSLSVLTGEGGVRVAVADGFSRCKIEVVVQADAPTLPTLLRSPSLGRFCPRATAWHSSLFGVELMVAPIQGEEIFSLRLTGSSARSGQRFSTSLLGI